MSRPLDKYIPIKLLATGTIEGLNLHKYKLLLLLHDTCIVG